MLEYLRALLPMRPMRPMRKLSRKLSPSDTARAVLSTLRNAGQPLSVTELAKAMGCSVGESSKRVKSCGKLLSVKRRGRCKMISRRELTLPEWQLEWQRLRAITVP